MKFIAYFPKGDTTQAIFICYWMNSEKHSCNMGDRFGSYYASTHALYIGTLSSKGCNTIYNVVKVGGSLGQGLQLR